MAKALQPVGAAFEGNVLDFFRRKRRYLLVGEVSLEFGVRLETVEFHLDELVVRGGLRHMSPAEKKAHGFDVQVIGYVLADPTKFTPAP